MKTTSLLILSLFLTINSFAQSGSSEPIQLNRNFLVHSAGLPEEFLLFAPDSATQILFNPARANNFSTSFIYLNYISDSNPNKTYPVYFTEETGYLKLYPGSLQKTNSFNFPSLYQETFSSSKNPTFSAAALVDINGAKWLFELTNGLSTNKFLRNYSNTLNNTNFPFPPNSNYSIDTTAYNHNRQIDANTSSLKISRIIKDGETNLSVGIFGVMLKDNDEETYKGYTSFYRFKDENEFDSSRYRNFNYENINNFQVVNDSRYAAGIEFAVNNKNLDYLGSIDYQSGDNSVKLNSNDDFYYSDSTYNSPSGPWYTSISMTRTIIDHSTNQKPSVVNINNYFRHGINLITPEDNIFITLNLFFSSGHISYSDKYEKVYINNNEIIYGDTTLVDNPEDFEIDNWGVSFSTGYVLSKSWSDLSALSGLKFAGSTELLEGIDEIYSPSGYPSFVRNKSKPTMASFTLPFYLNYSPADWFSVYGGINYIYSYTRYESDLTKSGTYPPPHYNYENIYLTKSDFENQGWQSYKSIYLGCELRHSSGLKVQFFFDENFTFIRNWNVSVGYHF